MRNKNPKIVELYHGTSSNRLAEIIECGKIEVSSKVEGQYIDSKYYIPRTYHLSTDGISMSVNHLLNDRETGIAKLDDELDIYIDNLYEEVFDNFNNINNLEGRLLRKAKWHAYVNTLVTIEVNEGNQNPNIVYLATQEKAKMYARNFLVQSRGLEFDTYKTNYNLDFGVLLKLKVSEVNLAPDLNDSRVDKNSSTPKWVQTYNAIGQCVHIGAIPIERIEEVTCIVPEPMKTEKYKDLGIPFNVPVSLNEIKDLIRMLKNKQYKDKLL